MGLLTSLKRASSEALPARVVSVGMNLETARLTGINPFGLAGWAALEVFPVDNIKLLTAGYLNDHYVFTIADWKARQFAKAPPIVYEIKDKKYYSAYKSLTPLQKADSYALRKKSIEEIDDQSDRLVKVLKNPNPFQTWSEFAYGHSVYYDFGNSLIYGIGPDGGKNAGQFQELYLLPTSTYSGMNPTTSGYEYFIDARGVNEGRIDGRKVLHIRQFNPDPNLQGGRLWGISKLASARSLLTKSKNAIEAEAEAMQNRGARTIIFPKGQSYDQDMTANGVRDATMDLRKKLKQAGSGGVGGLNVEVGSIEIGMSPVDLNIIESSKATREEFCALWHVDAIAIFSAVSEASRANAETAVKASLNTGVLPDQALLAAKLNQWLLPAYNEANKYQRYIEFNTDVYPELQTNKKEIADWADAVPLTGDQRLELFGWAATGLPEMQIPLLKNTLQPVSDFLAPTPDPNADPKNDGSYA